MTKEELQLLSDTNISDDVIIEASEHREVNDGLINELFPSTLRDSANLEIITNKLDPNKFYYAEFTKLGGVCFIRGYILNLTSNLLSPSVVFSFKETVNELPNPYLPDPAALQPNSPFSIRFVGKATRYIDAHSLNVHVVYDHVSNTSIFVVYDPIPGATGSVEHDKFMFNFSYNVKP